MIGPFGPLSDDHPLVGELCPRCTERFESGDLVGLEPLGPASEEDQAKAAAGRAHTTENAPVHWTCDNDDSIEEVGHVRRAVPQD